MRRLIAAFGIATLLCCAAPEGAPERVAGPRAFLGSCTVTIQSGMFQSPVGANTSGHLANFLLTNTTDSTEGISVTCGGTKTVTCTGVSPSLISLPAAHDTTVQATFSVGNSIPNSLVQVTACSVTQSDGPIVVD
jgi:hypothetical protein